MEGKPNIPGVGPEALPNLGGERVQPIPIADQEQGSRPQAIPVETMPAASESVAATQPVTTEPARSEPPPIDFKTVVATNADLPADELEASLAQQFENQT